MCAARWRSAPGNGTPSAPFSSSPSPNTANSHTRESHRKRRAAPTETHTSFPLTDASAEERRRAAPLAAERDLYVCRLREFFAHFDPNRGEAGIVAAVHEAQRRPNGLRSLWRALVEQYGPPPLPPDTDGTLRALLHPPNSAARLLAHAERDGAARRAELCAFFSAPPAEATPSTHAGKPNPTERGSDVWREEDGMVIIALRLNGMRVAVFDAASFLARCAFCRALEAQMSVWADCSPSRLQAAVQADGVVIARIGPSADNDDYDKDKRSDTAIAALLEKVLRSAPLLRIVRDSYRRDLHGGSVSMTATTAKVPPNPFFPSNTSPSLTERVTPSVRHAEVSSMVGAKIPSNPMSSVRSIMESVHHASGAQPTALSRTGVRLAAPSIGVRATSRNSNERPTEPLARSGISENTMTGGNFFYRL